MIHNLIRSSLSLWLLLISANILGIWLGDAFAAPIIQVTTPNTIFDVDMRVGTSAAIQHFPIQTQPSPDGAWLLKVEAEGTRTEPGTLLWVAPTDQPDEWRQLARLSSPHSLINIFWNENSQSLWGFLPEPTENGWDTSIVEVDLQTGEVLPRHTIAYQFERAILSPNQRYALLATTIEQEMDHMVLLDLVTWEPHFISDIPPYLLRRTWPVWSVDSRAIFYLARNDQDTTQQTYELHTYHPATGKTHVVADDVAVPTSLFLGTHHAAFHYHYQDGLLVFVDLGTGEVWSKNTSFNAEGAFSKDGRYFVYSETVMNGNTTLRILDLATRMEQATTFLEGFVVMLDWRE